MSSRGPLLLGILGVLFRKEFFQGLPNQFGHRNLPVSREKAKFPVGLLRDEDVECSFFFHVGCTLTVGADDARDFRRGWETILRENLKRQLKHWVFIILNMTPSPASRNEPGIPRINSEAPTQFG